MKTDNITFRAEPKFKKEVEEFAKSKGLSLASFATMVLTEAIKKEKA